MAYVSQTARRLGADLINLGVGGFSKSEFRERVSYMINKVGETSRPIFGITIFPYFNDFKGAKLEEMNKVKNFRKILAEKIRNSGKENIYLITGKDILENIGGLSTDLIHPADNGMIQMGENLARKIGKILNK